MVAYCEELSSGAGLLCLASLCCLVLQVPGLEFIDSWHLRWPDGLLVSVGSLLPFFYIPPLLFTAATVEIGAYLLLISFSLTNGDFFPRQNLG